MVGKFYQFSWNNIKLVGYVDFLLNDLVCYHDNKRGRQVINAFVNTH